MDLYNRDRTVFGEFLRNTDQKEQFTRYLREHFPRHAPGVAQAIRDGKDVPMLDIGPGGGHAFIPFASQFPLFFPREFDYDCFCQVR